MLVEEGLQVSLKKATLSKSLGSCLDLVYVLVSSTARLSCECCQLDDPKALGLGARAEAGEAVGL